MTTPANRRVCASCGANNFDTQAQCWQCGASLSGNIPAPPASRQPAHSDPTVSTIAAGALAFLAPAIAVVVGLVFLMTGDAFRIKVGTRTLAFAAGGILLHLIATPLLVRTMLAPMLSQAMSLVPKPSGLSPGAEVDSLRRTLSAEP